MLAEPKDFFSDYSNDALRQNEGVGEGGKQSGGREGGRTLAKRVMSKSN